MLNLKKLLTKMLAELNAVKTPKQETITYSNGTTSVTLYFRSVGTMLSVIASKGDVAMTLPTSWTTIGTLSSIRPQGDRFVPLITSGGQVAMLRILTTGSVLLLANTSTAMWLQSSGTVIYK